MINKEKNINVYKNKLMVRNSTYWWEPEGLCFECQLCGACCGGEPGTIWVTVDEIGSIAGFLGIDDSLLRQQYLTRNMGRNSIKEQENYDCIFLEKNLKRCKIYKVRPLQCRLFPFWPSILRNKNIWDYYSTRCPGMNYGKLYTQKMIISIQNMDMTY